LSFDVRPSFALANACAQPIDFEVFMQLARDAGFTDRGLKLIMKPFLDKHAVSFYGAEGTIGRSRVKKRALTELMAA
jgi:hypothetical protein